MSTVTLHGVENLAPLLTARGLTLAVAESCTGGLLAAGLTAQPGSSRWFKGGVVVYANEAKIALLGIEAELLAAEGAVSGPVARRMAEQVRERLGADYGVGLTGIAGPDGGSPLKPVGLVYIGLATPLGSRVRLCRFAGDRAAVRQSACETALHVLLTALTFPSARA